MVGGTGGHSTGPEQPAAMPERYESGTLNTPGIASLKAGVEYILETGMEVIRSKEEALARLLRDGLCGLPGVTIHGPEEPDRCGGIVSFTMDGTDPATIGFLLDRDFDISVRVGLHCAYSAHKAIGTWPAGTVRVSPGYFNTEEDINAFLEAVEKVAAGR
jgi:selenocysteine lyase/cysteine desulfurase